MHKKSGLFLGALLLSQVVLAAPLDKSELASESKHLGASLSELAKANTEEYCALDIDNAGSLLEKASLLIQKNRFELALHNLEFAEHMLSEVSYKYGDCSYFQPMTGAYASKIEHIMRELDAYKYRVSS